MLRSLGGREDPEHDVVDRVLNFLNQRFFTIYVVSVHGGDASFIAKYLPSGWFWLLDPRDQVVHWLAWHFPSAELLAPSVLRVQAFLELPFVLLAYLVGLRWLDAGLYRRVARSSLIWWAAASYTIVIVIAAIPAADLVDGRA